MQPVRIISSKVFSAGGISAALVHGLHIQYVPLISSEPALPEQLAAAAAVALRSNIWALTSPRAADFAAAVYNSLPLARRPIIYALGAATAAPLIAAGAAVRISPKASADSLAAFIISEIGQGSVCFFCGNLSLDNLPLALAAAGIRVVRAQCYQTQLNKHNISPEAAQAALIFSPSAAEALSAAMGQCRPEVVFAPGNTTAAAIQRFLGLKALILPSLDEHKIIQFIQPYLYEKK
jgi:uroporphyrinogen-III synthase